MRTQSVYAKLTINLIAEADNRRHILFISLLLMPLTIIASTTHLRRHVESAEAAPAPDGTSTFPVDADPYSLADFREFVLQSGSASGPDQIAAVTLNHTLRVSQACAAAVYIIDSESKQLRCLSQLNNCTAPPNNLSLPNQTAQLALASQQAVTANGLTEMAFPLMTLAHSPGEDVVHGVLHVWYTVPTELDANTCGLLESIAQQTAVVLDRDALCVVEQANHVYAERLAQRERVADDLILMGVALGALLDETEMLETICQQSLPIFGVHGAYLWLLQNEEIVATAAAGIGANLFRGGRLPLEGSDTLGAAIIRDRKAAYINHVSADNYNPVLGSLLGARSMFGVPFMRGAHVLGALILIDVENDRRFDDSDLDQLSLFGVQAALAIQNVRLFAETRRRLDQLRVVNEMGRVATSVLMLDPLMRGIADQLFSEFHYDVIGLLLVENDKVIRLQSLLTPERSLINTGRRQMNPIDGVAARAMMKSEPVLDFDHITLSMRVLGARQKPPTGWHELAVPLVFSGEVIGVLNIERHTAITTDDLDVLEPLSAQLAIAVSNVRLFDVVNEKIIERNSEIAEATLQLRIEKEHTEAILRSVADAVIVTDLTGQIIMANPMAERLLAEYSVIYAAGETGNSSLATHIRTLTKHLFNHETQTYTETIELAGLILQANGAKVIESEQEVSAVVVLRDITRMQEIDRLKTQFVSTVSHELRTPLSNIKLYLQLMQTGKPEKREQYQQVMEGEANRLERLIVDLLDISRLEQPGQRYYEQLDLNPLIPTVVEANLLQADAKQLRLIYHPSTIPLPLVKGNRDQLTQVFTNLISNAIHYTPDDGTINVYSRLTEQGIRIEVMDNGIGIAPEDQMHVFERFYRGQNVQNISVPGTGLGLAICKEIITLHGGTIGVESAVSQGSTFHVTLPLSIEETVNEA